MECCVCLETSANIVDCKCNTNICYRCFENYLLTFYETPLKTPCCMQCDRQYSIEFIGSIITKKFAKTYFKNLLKKREEIELQRPSVRVQLAIQRLAFQPELDKIKNELREARSKYLSLLSKRKQLEERIKSIKISIIRCSKCPDGNIDMSNMTCYTCKRKHCKTCHMISEDNHTCDTSILDTKKYLEMYVRKCPNCKIPVQKVNGCNHMYCSICKCAFDWSNMAVLKLQQPVLAQIPDYRNDRIQPLRDPLDVQCGGFDDAVVAKVIDTSPYLQTIRNSYFNINKDYTTLYNDIFNKNNLLDNARIKRLTNAITLDSFHKTIVRIENSNSKSLNKIQILSFFKNVLLDMLRCYNADNINNLAEIHTEVAKQYDLVRTYVTNNHRDLISYFPVATPHFFVR